MIRARSVSDAGTRRLYADGRNVSLTDDAMKFYATTPLAEFILNDPQKKFSTQIQGSQHEGKETLNGVPRKFVTTFKDREGSPQLTVDFSDWNLAAQLADSDFVFDPPKDAEKIDMAPLHSGTTLIVDDDL
jgi:hypothetical protein